MDTPEGEFGGKIMMRMQHDARMKRGGQRTQPTGELGASPRRLAQVVARQTRGKELREHGVLAGVFDFGGDDDQFHGTF